LPTHALLNTRTDIKTDIMMYDPEYISLSTLFGNGNTLFLSVCKMGSRIGRGGVIRQPRDTDQ
ncbi:hypothetical protein Bpfe_019167, partial [Biomphalaria pfeifferi]